MLFPRTIESPVPSFPAITMGTALEERQPNVHGAVLCSLPTQTLVSHYHNVLVNIPLLLVVSVAFFFLQNFSIFVEEQEIRFSLSCQITIF